MLSLCSCLAEAEAYLDKNDLKRIQAEAIIMMLSIWREALIAIPVLLVSPVNALISVHQRLDVVPCLQDDSTGAKLAEVDSVMQRLIA